MERRGYIKLLIFMSASLWNHLAIADGFFIDIGVGVPDFEINDGYSSYPMTNLAHPKISVNLGVGYKFNSGLFLVAESHKHKGLSFLDETNESRLDEVCKGIGYSFKYSNNLHISPTVLSCSWDLLTEEAVLFEPDPDAMRFRGNEVIGKLDFEILFNEKIIYISYVNGTYEFGYARAIMAGFKMYLR